MDQQYQCQQPPPTFAQQPQMAAAQPSQAAPAPTTASPGFPNLVAVLPTWVLAIRIVQALLSFVVLALCGLLIHGVYVDAQGFSIACPVFTWVAVSYVLLAGHVTSLKPWYNVFAILGLDLLLASLWLVAAGTNAAHRASFAENVSISGCSDDGSVIDSFVCWRSGKKGYLATRAGLAMMVALAVLCAVESILFAAVFGKTLTAYLQQRKSAAPPDAEKNREVVSPQH